MGILLQLFLTSSQIASWIWAFDVFVLFVFQIWSNLILFLTGGRSGWEWIIVLSSAGFWAWQLYELIIIQFNHWPINQQMLKLILKFYNWTDTRAFTMCKSSYCILLYRTGSKFAVQNRVKIVIKTSIWQKFIDILRLFLILCELLIFETILC